MNRSNFGAMMFRTAFTVLIAPALGCSNQKRCCVVPTTFCQVFADVTGRLPAQEIDSIRKSKKIDAVDLQMSFGMELRNTLDLWGENDLTMYFRSHGVEHPEMMSQVLTMAFIDYLKGKAVDMDALTVDARNELLPKPPPPKP